MRIIYTAIAAGMLGCTRDAGPSVTELAPAEALLPATESMSPFFGGAHPGQSYWLSRNGRYAVIYQWREDTNGDGQVSIKIGFHGEMEEDEPSPYVVEVVSNRVSKYDEFLAAAHGRWIVVRRGADLFVIDAERGDSEIINGGQIGGTDRNDCAGPRSVSFDPYHPRIGVIYSDPDRLIVRDLVTGERTSVMAKKDRLWRASFTAVRDYFLLHYVPEDASLADTLGGYPRQITTCSTRFGAMFARSYSFLGWDGPPFYSILVAGNEEVQFSNTPLVIASNLLLERDSLFDLSGAPILIPSNCEDWEVAPGAQIVLLQCGRATHLWDPTADAMMTLRRTVQLISDAQAVADDRGKTWIPVTIDDASGFVDRKRLGRLRIQDGRLEVGPVVVGEVSVEGGWVVARSNKAVHALEVSTARHVSVPNTGFAYLGFPVTRRDRGKDLIISPTDGTYMEVDNVGAVNDAGCIVVATGRISGWEADAVESGPWQLRCAARGPNAR